MLANSGELAKLEHFPGSSTNLVSLCEQGFCLFLLSSDKLGIFNKMPESRVI
jgi:hypothetical protein